MGGGWFTLEKFHIDHIDQGGGETLRGDRGVPTKKDKNNNNEVLLPMGHLTHLPYN